MDMIVGILPSESYNSFCALVDLFVCIKYTNKLYGAVAEETVAKLTMSLA
jgi:hypothetical protein